MHRCSSTQSRGEFCCMRAWQVYVHRLRRYLGAYLVQLGHVDAIIFSAGIGENAAEIRRLTLAGMQAPPPLTFAMGC